MPRLYCKEYPWYAPGDAKRRENGVLAARLMLNAALTAPTTGGEDHTEGEVVWGEEELDGIARKMEELAYSLGNKRLEDEFKYEAVMVRASDCVLLLGACRAKVSPFDVDCGVCGGAEGCSYVYKRHRTVSGLIDPTDRSLCKTMWDGPFCGIRALNLGFGIGSALWIASRLMVDSCAMMSAGLAGQRLGYCRNSELVVGLPVATLAKNPYVDIIPDYHVLNMDRLLDEARKAYILPRQAGPDFRVYRVKREGEQIEGEE